MTCETCKFWIKLEEYGECRRHAPQPRILTYEEEELIDPMRKVQRTNSDGQAISDISIYASWPKTFYGHWCGEHEEIRRDE